MRVIASPAYRNRDVNPYNYLLYTHVSRLGVHVEDFSFRKFITKGWDVWHLHWPEGYLNTPNRARAKFMVEGLLKTVSLAKKRGIKIVWTAHNVKSHEGMHPDLEGEFWEQFLELIDGYITLSITGGVFFGVSILKSGVFQVLSFPMVIIGEFTPTLWIKKRRGED